MARVLVIDDDPRLREVIAALLREAGHQVDQAADGREGLERFTAAPAEVVLCDIIMPGREGLATIRQLREQAPGVPIVAMSGGGWASPEDYLTLAREMGASLTLHKPFARRELLAAVGAALQA